VSPIRDLSGGRIIGASKIARDVSERKRIEEALLESDRPKDQFIALLAHELRNPLAPLRTALHVIRLAEGDPQRVRKAQDVMERQLNHMVRLVDDLLDISRISQNKLDLRRERVLFSDVVSQAVETARPAIEVAGHELTIAIPTTAIYLDADPTRLSQVLSNLLTNSAKYTDRGGSILLAAEQRPGEVTVSVRDTGIGLPVDALERIFDMFAQVDRVQERAKDGLGIGLALVKGLVEMHGGTVVAASDGPGAGSTFTVTLPLPPVITSPSSDARATPRPTAVGPRRRILVVDDNRDAADTLASMLDLMGHDVRVAYSGRGAIAAAETFRPALIFMDIGMPDVNGYEATQRVRAQEWAANVRVIAVTGWGQESDRARSRSAGCDEHLVKPVEMEALQKLLISELDS
jgi:CheY-like chemotaxis protein